MFVVGYFVSAREGDSCSFDVGNDLLSNVRLSILT